jgi:hypothetical protein
MLVASWTARETSFGFAHTFEKVSLEPLLFSGRIGYGGGVGARYVTHAAACGSVQSHENQSLRITPLSPDSSPQSALALFSVASKSFFSAGEMSSTKRILAKSSSFGLAAVSAMAGGKTDTQMASRLEESFSAKTERTRMAAHAF